MSDEQILNSSLKVISKKLSRLLITTVENSEMYIDDIPGFDF